MHSGLEISFFWPLIFRSECFRKILLSVGARVKKKCLKFYLYLVFLLLKNQLRRWNKLQVIHDLHGKWRRMWVKSKGMRLLWEKCHLAKMIRKPGPPPSIISAIRSFSARTAWVNKKVTQRDTNAQNKATIWRSIHCFRRMMPVTTAPLQSFTFVSLIARQIRPYFFAALIMRLLHGCT